MMQIFNRKIWLVLWPAMTLPFLASLCYFVFYSEHFLARLLYALTKLFTLAWPIFVVVLLTKTGAGHRVVWRLALELQQADAQKAISMFNAYRMDERELTVNLARPREERGGSGGFGDRDRDRGGRDRRGGGGQRRY